MYRSITHTSVIHRIHLFEELPVTIDIIKNVRIISKSRIFIHSFSYGRVKSSRMDKLTNFF